MKTFKGGGYDRLYGTAVQEAKEAIRLIESGQPTTIVLPKILRDNDELAFGTFAQYVALPTPFLEKMDSDLPVPIYRAAGTMNNFASVESRLRRARKLVPRTEARVIKNRANTVLNFLLSPVDIQGVKEERKLEALRSRMELGDALQGHSAFMNLVRRQGNMSDITKLIRDEWTICVTGQPEFKLEHAEWLYSGAKGRVLSLADIPLDEDMFIRDEISEDESMKISGIRLNVEGKRGFLSQTTKSQIGLYQINKEMEEWAEGITAKLRERTDRPVGRNDVLALFSKDREWVNDDTLLIQSAIVDFEFLDRNSEAALVSRDKRLANQMSESANIRVILLDPKSVVQCFPDKPWSSTTLLEPEEVYQAYGSYNVAKHGLKTPHRVYIDTGSLLAETYNLDFDESGGRRKYFQSRLVETGTRNGTRYEVFDRKEIPYQTNLELKVYDPQFKTRRNRPKPSSYASSSSSSRFDWGMSQEVSFDEYITRRMRNHG
jgi:hypothetical protein